MKKKLFRVVIVAVLISQIAVGSEPNSPSYYSYPNNPLKLRNPLGRAVISFLVPGFDQWVEGQIGAGIAYSGIAALGLGTAIAVGGNLNASLTTRDDKVRATFLGAQAYQTMGSLSSYHAFRSSIVGRKAAGEYPFLTIEETPWELAAAPFRFDYLIRPTTFGPLLLLAGLVILEMTSGSGSFARLSTSDGFFAAGFSYQAGLGEEALFRGIAQPAIMELATNKRAFVANLARAAVFGAAHYSEENKLPLIQFLFGLYMGWLTELRQYTISENIFIHVWWDVVAFSAAYATSQKIQSTQKTSRPTYIYLPIVNMQF